MIHRSAMFAVVRRPRLWLAAVGSVTAFAPVGWWRHPPFVPIPDEELIAWRTATAYGTDDIDLATADIVSYLEWRQRFAQG